MEKKQVSSKAQWVVISALVSLVSMLIVTGIVFLATVRAKDETIVPRVVGISLSEAMLLLQNSDLTAVITTNFVEDPSYEAGLVLQQKPAAGSYLKVGQAIELSVSAGLAITHVEDFIGMRMEDVRTAIITRYNGLLSIKEPLIYLSSEEAEGTIIGQDPKAGMPLSGPVAISFLISRGMVQNMPIVTAYEGIAIDRALIQAGQNNLPMIFILEGEAVEGYPVVKRQEPAPGQELAANESVRFYVSPVASDGDIVLATKEIRIPSNSNPYKIEVVALHEEREELLLSTYQQGVSLVIAYYQPSGTIIAIRVNGEEKDRFIV